MNRRNFIRNSALAGASLAALGGAGAWWYKKKGIVKLTILHTNDVHSRIDPFPDSDSKFPGLGGFARRAEMVKQIRQQEKNVLLFDSGDIFQGTPYFNYYGGELEFKLMSEMGYDGATYGNHDFDNGIEGLVKQLPHASFPFINSNYDLAGTPLERSTLRNKVFERDGIRVGVFGLGIELQGLVNPKLYGDIRYQDPIDEANRQAEFLKKEEGCDLVVCLSHLGYDYNAEKYNFDVARVCDKHVAKNTRHIDVILGGHTHTFLDEPDLQTDMDGNPTMICQVGWAGIKLGRLDLFFDVATRAWSGAYIAPKVFKSQ
jgi:5'-nucleotidase